MTLSRLNTVDRLTGRPVLPPTRLQAMALAALSDVPAGPTALSVGCSLSAKQMHTALWGLAGKGLAVRTDRGWTRVPERHDLLIHGWTSECGSCRYGRGSWADSPALEGKPILTPESRECPNCGVAFTHRRRDV